jgi:lipopolysaccharide export system protein LptC
MSPHDIALTKASRRFPPIGMRDQKNLRRRNAALAALPRHGVIAASKRHSAWVLWLRRGIIVASCLFVLLIGGFILFDPFRRLPKNISIGHVSMSGTKVIVDSPKIAGLQQNGQAYEITARSGTEDVLKPHIIELDGVNATIGLADASKLQVLAANGIYDNQTDKVVLTNDVTIKNAASYNIKMRQAVLNFKTNVLNSDELIVMDIDGGSIRSDAITISENGNKLSFDRNVHSTFETLSNKKDPE